MHSFGVVSAICFLSGRRQVSRIEGSGAGLCSQVCVERGSQEPVTASGNQSLIQAAFELFCFCLLHSAPEQRFIQAASGLPPELEQNLRACGRSWHQWISRASLSAACMKSTLLRTGSRLLQLALVAKPGSQPSERSQPWFVADLKPKHMQTTSYSVPMCASEPGQTMSRASKLFRQQKHSLCCAASASSIASTRRAAAQGNGRSAAWARYCLVRDTSDYTTGLYVYVAW